MKDKLARGEVVASMTVRLVRGIEIARIAKTAGFDSLYVDMEHSSFSLETTGQICRPRSRPASRRSCACRASPKCRACSMPARSASSRRMSSSAAEARDYVRAAKYPPLGERSAGGPLPHLHYRSFPAAEADAALNAATTLMVQFESEEALAKADEIAAVEGVDMVHDRIERSPRRLRACRPIRTCAAARRLCQNHRRLPQARQACRRRRPCIAPDLAAEFVRMGARYVSTGTDLGFLLAACTAKAKEVRDISVDGKN